VSGLAVGALALGGLFMWSGIKGTSVLGSVQDLIQGKRPRTSQLHPINQPPPAAAAQGGSSTPRSGGGGGGGGGITRATPPTVPGSQLSKLPKLPTITPPNPSLAPYPTYVPPQTRLIAPPAKKSGSTWWKPWTW
jgi:hypothetical protein